MRSARPSSHRLRSAGQLTLTVGAALTTVASAAADPLRTPATGATVGSGIATDFALHLGATAAPFVVLFAIVAIVERGWPPWGGGA